MLLLHVNGVKGMKRHIRSCKSNDISNYEPTDNYFIMCYYADNDFEVNDDISIDDRIHQNDQIVQKYYFLQRRLLQTETVINTGTCLLNNETFFKANWKNYLEIASYG